MEGLIWAVPGCVEFGLEALESSVSESLHPDLTPQSVAGLATRGDIPLLTLLENKLAKVAVFPLSSEASSTVKVELSTKLSSCGTRYANQQLDSI